MRARSRQLTEFAVLTMDCYGTLIDWESGIWTALQPVLAANDVAMSRGKALGVFAELESAAEAAHPTTLYPEILASVHRSFSERFELETTTDLDGGFGASVADWPAFEDATESLNRLAAHYKLVILSNVDRAGFAASNRHLQIDFDAVYTAEEIGSYKPSQRNFDHLLQHMGPDLGLGPTDVLHTAQSLFHDHVMATRNGLATAWIDRQGLSDGGDWGATAVVDDAPTTDFVFSSMRELADAADDAFA